MFIPRLHAKWFVGAAIVLAIFGLGLWLGWHKETITTAISKHLAKARAGEAESCNPTALTLAVASPIPALTPATSTVSVADRLRKQAEAARESGDTVSALARLQDASQRDPRNAEVLAEMAMIYESIQNFDRSAETWRKVQEIGPSAGPLYELADMKLKTGVPGSLSTTGAALPGISPNDGEGIPAGSILGINKIETTKILAQDAEKNLTLRISVKKRPNAVIDHTKVKIQVFFYDTVGDNDIKLTDADVSYEWLTPNHDRADSNSETLAVAYIRPKSKAKSAESHMGATAAAVNPVKKGKPVKASPQPEVGARKYLGYIVRVYYNDQLQDKRADPAKLLNLFPAPLAFESKTEDKSASAGSLVEQARQAYQQRDLASALKFVNDADAADPNQPATLTLRGEILMEQKQFDQAETEFKKALKADSKFRQAQFNLASVPLKIKDYATARDRFEALLSKTPGGDKSEAAQLIKFNVYMTWLLEGKDSRAQQFHFTDGTPALYYAQAAWEFKHNNPTKATDWITSAKKIYSPALNVVFADSFYDLGWIRSPKANPAEQQSSSPYASAADFAKYAMKVREQAMQPKEKTFESTAAASPKTTGNLPAFSKAEAQEIYSKAFQAFEADNFSEAIKELDAIDARQPDLAESHNLRGVLFMRHGMYDKADAALQESIRINPKFWIARFNLAEIPFLKKDWVEARNRFQELLSTSNASELQSGATQLIQYNILLTYLLEGKENMVDSLLAKFELSPDTPALHYANAAIALQQNKTQEAKDWMAQAEKNFSPQSNKMFAESLYEVGLLKRPPQEVGHPGAANR
jgi:tetratricopeptide (TPR) repeat protein